MLNNEKDPSVNGIIILILVLINVFILKIAFIQNEKWYDALIIALPLLLVALMNNSQKNLRH